MNSYKSRDKQIKRANRLADLVDKANRNEKFSDKEESMFTKYRYGTTGKERNRIYFDYQKGKHYLDAYKPKQKNQDLYSSVRKNSFREQNELANMRVDKQIHKAQRTAGLYSKYTKK